jgi:hypothetical protein
MPKHGKLHKGLVLYSYTTCMIGHDYIIASPYVHIIFTITHEMS